MLYPGVGTILQFCPVETPRQLSFHVTETALTTVTDSAGTSSLPARSFWTASTIGFASSETGGPIRTGVETTGVLMSSIGRWGVASSTFTDLSETSSSLDVLDDFESVGEPLRKSVEV